jgi:hypothetical protein
MATISGDTGDGVPRPPYGVLGIGVPGSFVDQDGNTENVMAVGVFGVTGNRSDISNEMDDINNNLDMLINAGVAGVLPTSTPSGTGTASYEAIGFLAGKNPFADGDIGAFGQSDGTGVAGIANKANGVGVYGGSVGGVGNGVVGETNSAIGVTGRANGASAEGVRGENTHGGLAGHFVGNVSIDSPSTVPITLNIIGSVSATGSGNFSSLNVIQDIHAHDVILSGGDCAEHFDLADNEFSEAGAVMVMDEGGRLRQCREAYDRRVAGVVSGAGGYQPGIILDRQASSVGNRMPIALAGKVFCRIDASFSAIEAGDLLTTSPTPGHAMKADPTRAFGAVIGKALRPLQAGQGLIPILVALQ